MTTTDTAPAAPTAEDFAAIKANRDSILAEKRDLRSKLDALQAQLDEANAGFEQERKALIKRAETAEKRVYDYEINYPVANFLADVTVDPVTFQHVFNEAYRFALVDGDVGVVDLEGQPVHISDGKGGKKVVRLDSSDFRNLLYPNTGRTAQHERFGRLMVGSKASGGGAVGVSQGSGGNAPAQPEPKAPSAAPAATFGLGRRRA